MKDWHTLRKRCLALQDDASEHSDGVRRGTGEEARWKAERAQHEREMEQVMFHYIISFTYVLRM